MSFSLAVSEKECNDANDLERVIKISRMADKSRTIDERSILKNFLIKFDIFRKKVSENNLELVLDVALDTLRY